MWGCVGTGEGVGGGLEGGGGSFVWGVWFGRLLLLAWMEECCYSMELTAGRVILLPLLCICLKLTVSLLFTVPLDTINNNNNNKQIRQRRNESSTTRKHRLRNRRRIDPICPQRHQRPRHQHQYSIRTKIQRPNEATSR